MDERERLARIRLVSQRYHELQGLRGALIGSAFTFAMGGYLATTGWNDDGIGPAIALGLVFAVIIPGMLWLDRYYETTFGRVTGGRGAKGSDAFLIFALVAVVVPIVVIWRSDLGIFLFIGTHALWMAIRDWPLRRYHLLGGAAGTLAAAIQLTEAAREAPQSAMAAGFLVIGVANVLTGFADHRLFTSSMAVGRTAQPAELSKSERPASTPE